VYLTNTDFSFPGVDSNFGELQAQVLFMIAFVLGFYSRVAREQLNLIVKSIFGKAYSKTEEVFSVTPRKSEVVFGANETFTTSPTTEVTWMASAGKISTDGVFDAPKAGEKDAVSGSSVLITAVPTDPNIPRATAAVTLVEDEPSESIKPFEIAGPEKVGVGEILTEAHTVEPAPDGGVTWSIEGSDCGASIGEESGILTGPDPVQIGEATAITIKATSKVDANMYAEYTVTIKPL